MNALRSVSAILSGIIAFSASMYVPAAEKISRYSQKTTAYAANVIEREYTLEIRALLNWRFSDDVAETFSSDTSVCTTKILDENAVQISAVSPGYADVTVNTVSGYVYVIHITVPGDGITTAPKTTASAVTTTTAASTVKTTAATSSAVSTAVASSTSKNSAAVTTVTTRTIIPQPALTTIPTELVEFPGNEEYFALAAKESESLDITRSTFSAVPTYNLFGDLDYVTEMTDSNGNIYAAIGSKDSVIITQKSTFHHIVLNNPGYTFAAATFGDDDHIYALWGKDLTSADTAENNVVVTKFTKNGGYVAMYPLSSEITNSMYPFDGGNGRLAYNNGKLAVMFDTEWTSGHQGAEFFRLDTATGLYDVERTNICSHSFGLDLIPTENGFVSLQKGDCYDRGLILHEIPNSAKNLTKSNAWHISGIYMEPGEHKNATFTHMGGIAVNPTSYAIVGKSERFYTSADYQSYKTGIYDGFVRIISRNGETDIGGADRIDEQTGTVADQNVIWLTDSSGEYKTGNIKVAALSGNRYCVLWETLNGKTFDHVSYVIISNKGTILQPETLLANARLSSKSVDPIVQNDILTWAVADSYNQTLDWYSLDTNCYAMRGDVNSDGIISAADLVKFSKYLIAGDTLDYMQASSADLTSDGVTDTFDMIALRKKVIENSK